MKTPAPAPEAPPRGIIKHSFDVEKGDRFSATRVDAIARARARAPKRGRQQVYPKKGQILGDFWVIQDVR